MVLRRNPTGGAVGLVANGVGLAAESREPRQQQIISREESRPSNGSAAAGPSQSHLIPGSPGLPPSYADSVAAEATPSIASGRPVSDDKSSTGSLLSSDSEADSDGFDVESLQDDEEDWALDEAVPDPPSYEEIEGQRRTSDELVQDVLTTSHNPVQVPQAFEPLPYPVIIPQRRPGDKGRGFVRAYAPILANNGIEQEQFLAFLKSFHKASQASPIFTAIQVSASIASFAPSVIAMGVATAMNVASRHGREVQYRQRANHFLDRMNEEMFKPAGLYAMVVKYKQDSNVDRNSRYTQMGAHIGIGTEKINLTASHAIAKYDRTVSNESSNTLSSRIQDLQLAPSSNNGLIELPEAAPLIFPYLDRAIDLESGPEGTHDRVKDLGAFVEHYRDRKAYSAFAMNDSEKALASPEDHRGMKSKFADPGSPSLNAFGSASYGILASKRQRRLDKHADKFEKTINKHLEKSQEKVLKYERKLSEGRLLSRHKMMKYARHSQALESLTGHRSNLCGQSRGGLISSLLATAIDASGYNEKQPGRDAWQHGNGLNSRHDHSSSSTLSLARSRASSSNLSPVSARHQARREAREQSRAARASGPTRRMMKENVLYLMIVNMPSPAELVEARELLGIPQR